GEEHEGGGQEDDLRTALGQLTVQLGEADVVANGETGGVTFDLGGDDVVAGGDGGGFESLDAAGDVDIVEVELAVAGDLGAGAVEEHAGVVGAVPARDVLVDGTGE